MKAEGNQDRTQDEAKDTLRIKGTGCADLFDILLFKNKINVVLGLEIAPKLTKNPNFSTSEAQFYTLYVIDLCKTEIQQCE